MPGITFRRTKADQRITVRVTHSLRECQRCGASWNAITNPEGDHHCMVELPIGNLTYTVDHTAERSICPTHPLALHIQGICQMCTLVEDIRWGRFPGGKR